MDQLPFQKLGGSSAGWLRDPSRGFPDWEEGAFGGAGACDGDGGCGD
jgi:hypothetical protein